jgi:hypothetical protein
MLFRTVYGPELEAIYNFVSKRNTPISRQTIHNTFSPVPLNVNSISTQNIDDALSFLMSANLVSESGGHYIALEPSDISFELFVIRRLLQLSKYELEIHNPIDPLYMYIFDELFVKSDQLFILDIHKEANKLQLVSEVGGLSKEKIQSWKRVMEFLGMGRRISTGFQFVYSVDLVLDIFNNWEQTEAPLQSFFEEHFSKYLPYRTTQGGLPQSLESTLLYLEKINSLNLYSRQDIPNRAYFGEMKYKFISYHGGNS